VGDAFQAKLTLDLLATAVEIGVGMEFPFQPPDG